eukprot:71254-Chlamydomonas_euryale.AAC.1
MIKGTHNRAVENNEGVCFATHVMGLPAHYVRHSTGSPTCACGLRARTAPSAPSRALTQSSQRAASGLSEAYPACG